MIVFSRCLLFQVKYVLGRHYDPPVCGMPPFIEPSQNYTLCTFRLELYLVVSNIYW